MMIRIGNFLFRFRNWLFPPVIALVFVNGPSAIANETLAVTLGFAIAIVGQVLRAITIGLAYIKRGGKNRQVYAKTLVQDGMFAHCRNPLYLGNLLMLLGLGLLANAWWFLVVGMPFFVFAYIAIVTAEENFLRSKFGPEFDDYCRRVPRFVPNLAGIGKTWRGMEFKWRRLIVKEHGSTYAWTLAAIAALIEYHWIKTHSLFQPEIYVLMAALAMVTLGYATVRYLKKNRRLVAD
jgi:protein-S-isoprenylcysteine O-methyltransferase Ste14